MKLAALLLMSGMAWAESVPGWVWEAAARAVPTYPATVSKVVLLQEEQLTVAADGRRVMRERGVIRILQRTRDKLYATRGYNRKTGRIRDFRGWLMPAGGTEQSFAGEQIVDLGLSKDSTESRMKSLECPATAPPGSVFAWEIVEEEKTVFTQYPYYFQEDLPVVTSRFVLALPPGWTHRAVFFNHDAVAPTATDGVYTWELRDLPWIEPEDFAPGTHEVAPRLGISCYPPAENRAGLRAQTDWTAVSQWLTELADPAAEVTAAIRAKAAELTSASTTEFDRIRAIGAFVQQTIYVSVQMNLARGGGYVPHPATQVLERNYGDCKDKAALAKALLNALGVEAYATVVHSGDRRFVRPEWPSSMQFNHAIVAIRVSPAMDQPAAADYPGLGRLLLFDPTDPHTPPGELPEYEQGSRMLVLAGAKGELITAPRPPAAAHRVESAIEGSISGEGALQANLDRRYYGRAASQMRATLREDGAKELRRTFEGSFAQRLGRVVIGEIEPADRPQEQHFEVQVKYEVPQFAKRQASLLLIQPGLLAPGTRYGFPAKPRKRPVSLKASLRVDRIAIQLPAGFKVDEMPEPLELKTLYGTYRGRYQEGAGKLVLEQSLEVADVIAPAADYGKVREFFEKVSGYQQAAVVLAK